MLLGMLYLFIDVAFPSYSLAILDITPCTEYTCHCGMTDPSGSYILCDLCYTRYKYTTTLTGAELEKRVRLVAKLRKESSDLVGPVPHAGECTCLHIHGNASRGWSNDATPTTNRAKVLVCYPPHKVKS